MDSKQKNIFLDHEANAWYERNKKHYDNIDGKSGVLDYILKTNYIRSCENILEVGCSNGYHLNLISKHFNAKGYGIEPSSTAIDIGKNKYLH